MEAASGGRKTSEKCCGDAHPAASKGDAPADCMERVDDAAGDRRSDEGDSEDEDGDDHGREDTDNSKNTCGDSHPAGMEFAMQATECRVTSSRHDDWLHRGLFTCVRHPSKSF